MVSGKYTGQEKYVSVRKFALSTLMLMSAALIVRVLGFVYRIFLTNIIGAEGMGLYQLVTPVYALIVMTITSGVSITSSRMISAHGASLHNRQTIDRIVAVGIGFASMLASVISLFVYLFASPIANRLLGDPRTLLSIKILMPCIPFVAAASGLRGYYYGIQKVAPAAAAQVFEQLGRMTLVFVLAGRVKDMGLDHLCALAVGAAAFGELANFTVMLLAFPFYRRSGRGPIAAAKEKPERYRVLIRQMVSESVPISVNRLITSLSSTIETIIIPQRLIAGGMAYKTAIEEFGLLTGMAMPLLYFPSVLTSSLSTSLVAEISSGMASSNYTTVNNRISKSVFITTVTGFLFSAVFFSLPDAVSEFVFPGLGVGTTLKLMSVSCVFLYLQMIMTGIMNGLGKQTNMLINTLIGDGIRILFVIFALPIYGINGYAFGLPVSTSVVCFLCFVCVHKETGLKIDIVNWFLKPLAAAVITIFLCRFNYVSCASWFGGYMSGRLATMTAVGVSCLQYLIILIVLKGHSYFFNR